MASEKGEIPDDGKHGPLVVRGWWAATRGLESDDAESEGEDSIVVFRCRRTAPQRDVDHPTFGTGKLVEDRGDRVVVDFPKPHGRKTMLRRSVVR